jgi:heptosyltransferase-1
MNVLIVKLSKLGDVAYAMPAAQDILSELPGVRLDWVVEPAFAPLVRRCAGVHRVIECNLRQWRETVFTADTRTAWRAFTADLQYECYDAVLDLQSTGTSALVAKLARLSPHGLRYTLTAQAADSHFDPPIRREADVSIPVEPHLHAIDRLRVLCARALVYALPKKVSFGIAGQADKESIAIKNIANQFFNSGPAAHPLIVPFLHGSSRDERQWPVNHWLELGHRLNALGYTVAFAHSNDEEQWRSESIASRLEQAVVWPRMGLNNLTDALAECMGVVAVDSGLGHVAVALDLPIVQIYNVHTVRHHRTPKNGHQLSVCAEPTPDVDAVWNAWMQASALAALRDSMR